MKKILFVLFFLLLKNVLSAQQFQMVSSSGSMQYPNLSIAHDTSYVLSYAYNYGFRIDTFSRAGQFISGKNYQRSNSASPVFYGFKRDLTGNTYAFGSSNYLPSTSNDHSAIIYKLDSSGSTIWSGFAHSNFIEDAFQDVYISPGGSVYAAGTGTGSTSDYTSPMVVKYSPSGQVLFAKIFTAESQYNWHSGNPVKIVAVDDTNLFVLGTFDSQLGYPTIFITEIDTLGNPKWTRFVAQNVVMQNLAVNDTSIYITGTAHYNDAFLMNIDFSGNLNWLKSYGSVAEDKGQVVSIKENGNLLIGGNTNVVNQQYDAFFLMEVDKNGDLVWSKYHQVSSRNSNFMDIDQVDSVGDFVATGVETSSIYISLYIEADKANGLSGCNETQFPVAQNVSFPAFNSCLLRTSTLISTGTSYNLVSSVPVSIFSGLTCSSNCNVNPEMLLSGRHLCYGDSLFLQASDTALVFYQWYLNDSLIGTNASVHISMVYPGLDTLKLIVSNGNCVDSSIQYVSVKNFPVAHFSLLRNYHLLSLTNTSQDDDYITWAFSDGTTSTADFFKYNFTDTGFVYFQEIAYNICGIDSLHTRIRVNDSTESNFSKAYDTPIGYLNASDFALSPDGGILTSGTSSLSKTSITGKPLWAANVGLAIDHIASTSDLGYICTSSTSSTGTFRVVKIDSTGRSVWGVDGGQTATMGDVTELPNHDLIAGGSVGPSSNAEAIIICINKYGTVKWYRKFSALSRIRKLLVSSNAIYAVGDLFYKTGILKLDFDGSEIWNKNYGGALSDFAVDANFLTDDKIIVYSTTYSYGYGYSDNWLICCDTLGNIFWSKVYGTAANENPFSLICLGKKIVISFSISTSTPSYHSFVLDSLGVQIGSVENPWNALSPPVCETATNYESQLITLGKAVNTYDYFLQKINIDSSISSCFSSSFTMPSMSITPGISTGSTFVYDLTATRAYGFTNSTVTAHESAYCSTDNCSQQANFTYGFSNDTVNFINTTSGSLTNVLWDFGNGQQSTQNNPSHVYMYPGQYNVCLYAYSVCAVDTFCQSVNVIITSNTPINSQSDFTEWPNPVTDILYLKFSNNSNKKIEIVDMSGITVLSLENANKNETSVDVSNLADGVYLIIAINNEGVVSRQKLVVERE